MRWQVSRGVLAPPGSARPGSQWWRAVSEGLLRDAWEADRLTAGRRGPASSPAVSRWTDFLRKPSAQAWYRAHNSSIVTGYLQHRHLSQAELPLERFFMDVALGRLLYMHALVTRPRLALGRLQAAGRLISDPRWRSAGLFLSLPNVLPDRYPLTAISISDILKAENCAGRLIDYGVILPRIQALYEFAAADLQQPRLLSLIQDGFPVYAWDYRQRHAWTTARARTARSVLFWLTSALPAANARHMDGTPGDVSRHGCAVTAPGRRPGTKPSETRLSRMAMVAPGIGTAPGACRRVPLRTRPPPTRPREM
jgi:hypothetical protein